MNSPHFVLGFFTGLIIVLIVALVIALIVKKKNGPAKYDERQELLRGRAFKYAFLVLIAYLCLNGLLQVGTGLEWADLMTSSFIGICLSVTVFVVICIMNDAYFAFNQKPKFYLVMFGVLIAVNLTIGIFNLTNEDVRFVTDGKLNFHVLSFIVVVIFLAVFIALAIKTLMAKRQADRSRL